VTIEGAGHHLTIVQEVPDAATFNVTAQFFIVNLVLSNLSSAFCSNSNSNSRKCICVVRACSSGLLAILLELWPLTRANLGQICDLSLAGS